MSRVIKFRALSTNNKDWIYGFPLNYGWADVIQIVDCHGERKNVKPNTFCQFTGLKDKNGVEIYEGDILDYQWKSSTRDLLIVEWSEKDACFLMGGVKTDYAIAYGEVVGNIYENPELLEVQS